MSQHPAPRQHYGQITEFQRMDLSLAYDLISLEAGRAGPSVTRELLWERFEALQELRRQWFEGIAGPRLGDDR